MSIVDDQQILEVEWPSRWIPAASVNVVPWHFKTVGMSAEEFGLITRSSDSPAVKEIRLDAKAGPILALLEIEYQKELRILSQMDLSGSLQHTYIHQLREEFLSNPKKYANLPSGKNTVCPKSLFKWASRAWDGYQHSNAARKQYADVLRMKRRECYVQDPTKLGKLFFFSSCPCIYTNVS